jgi:O-antigen/teichoic acid export membrane protein
MGITRASFILFLGNLVGMGGYCLFQIYMSRALTPAEFGIVNALQALFSVIAAPASIFAQSLNRHFGQSFALRKLETIRRHYVYFFRGLICFSVAAAAVYYALSSSIGEFLRIEGRTPLLITGVWIFSFFFLQLNQGFLGGGHCFTSMSVSLGIQGGCRWIFGVLLVVAGFGLNGALSAQPLAFLVAYGVTVVAVFSQLPARPAGTDDESRGSIDLYRFFRESCPIFFAWVAFMILTNVDMLLIKHYLAPPEAGMYSSLAVLGRGVLFLSEAVAVGMFSIGVHESVTGAGGFDTYHRAIALCVLMYSVILLPVWLASKLIVKTIFGENYLVNAPFLILIGISMAVFGLLRILINFNLSRKSAGFIILLYLGVLAEGLLITLYHDNIFQILMVMVVVSGTLFAVSECSILVEQKKWQGSR